MAIRRRRVLIVDDDEGFVRHLTDVLAGRGEYCVSVVDNQKAAIADLRNAGRPCSQPLALLDYDANCCRWKEEVNSGSEPDEAHLLPLAKRLAHADIRDNPSGYRTGHLDDRYLADPSIQRNLDALVLGRLLGERRGVSAVGMHRLLDGPFDRGTCHMHISQGEVGRDESALLVDGSDNSISGGHDPVAYVSSRITED